DANDYELTDGRWFPYISYTPGWGGIFKIQAFGINASKSVAVTAGTTYLVVGRWDLDTTLDGTNYMSISVNDVASFGGTSWPFGIAATPTDFNVGGSSRTAPGIIEGLTIYRRPLFDGTYGIDVGNGDEINQIYNSGTGKDPTLVTGSWDVVFALPTNASTGALATGTGNAWSHPHASNLLYTSTINTGGFMMNGTASTDGWAALPGEWWTAGGSTGVVAAYQPIGATDLANSYVNKANPGTYDAAPGVAPTWDATNGWSYNGTTQYLTTGITPANGWSAITRFSNISGDSGALFGTYNYPLGGGFVIYPNVSSKVYYYNPGANAVAPNLTLGVLGVAGSVTYRNGVSDGTMGGSWPASLSSISLGSNTNQDGVRLQYLNGLIQATAFYNTTLTAPQVSAVTTAMQNLGTNDNVSALATAEKIFSGGYKVTSYGTNQGITRSFAATNGGDYVLRALGHSDGTCSPQVKITRADGTTEISHLDGTTTSTRTDPDVYIFTWESPAAESEQVQLINTASSGTCYWHQVEVLANLINNPSMETGAGDPWIPTGWTNTDFIVGDTETESIIKTSGNNSMKWNTTTQNKKLHQDVTVAVGDYINVGFSFYGDGSRGLFSVFTGNNFRPLEQHTTGVTYPGNSLAEWKLVKRVARQNLTPTTRFYVQNDLTASPTYLDDTYAFVLTPVSLTVTPASEANSLESTGLRVDGTDTLTQPITNLTATAGTIKFKFTPRHSFAVADLLGVTSPVIATLY
ncbi:hypothetical protein COY32_05630, partial [candidate division WWE3 bacterium CG_4_10_14_0_2_um_filter_41_14]